MHVFRRQFFRRTSMFLRHNGRGSCKYSKLLSYISKILLFTKRWVGFLFSTYHFVIWILFKNSEYFENHNFSPKYREWPNQWKYPSFLFYWWRLFVFLNFIKTRSNITWHGFKRGLKVTFEVKNSENLAYNFASLIFYG